MNEKPTMLFIGDDPRFFSGVGVMTREIIKQTAHKYKYTVIAGAHQHPDAGKIIDFSAEIARESGVKDAYCKLYPCHGYGDANILFQLLAIEKPNVLCMITDPRFYTWLFAIEHQVHAANIPICYINIWDNLPYPMWNKPFYESCDALFSISKQTYNINKWVMNPSNCIAIDGGFDSEGNLIPFEK